MGFFAQFGDPDKDRDYIEGPGQKRPYVKWFEPFSLKPEVPGSAPIRNNGSAQSPVDRKITTIWLTLPTDARTPLLFQANAKGTLFKSVIIEGVQGDDQPITKIQLSDVVISGIQTSNNNPEIPSSIIVRLEFTKATFYYKANPNAPASPGRPESVGWDLMSDRR